MTYHLSLIRCILTAGIILIVGIFPIATANLLPSGVENPLPLLYPELGQAPAPSWLEEGIRASYTSNVGLSTTYENYFGSSAEGKAGSGITQTDITGISDGLTATTNTIYSLMPSYNTYELISSLGWAGPVGCNAFWCNADVLATIPDRSDDTLVVQHLPYVMDGEEYSVIRFDCLYGDQKNTIALVYDLESGLLLYHTINTGTEEIRRGYVDTTVTSGNSGYYQLKNLRKLTIPWATGSVPPFVIPGATQQFTGQKEVSVPNQIGGPAGFGRQQTLSTEKVYSRFATYRLDMLTQDITTSRDAVSVVSGISQLAGFFIPPQAAGTGSGVIDNDPDTGMQTSITRNDASGIVLTRTNNVNQQSSFWYDTSGKLIQTITETHSSADGFPATNRVIMQSI
jgi:hypothetical protein